MKKTITQARKPGSGFPLLPSTLALVFSATMALIPASISAQSVHFRTFTKSGTDTTMRLAKFITTHYDPNQPDSILVGDGSDPDPRMLGYPKDGYPFNDALRPAFNNYHQQITSRTEVKITSSGDDDSAYSIDADALVAGPDSVPDLLNNYINKYRREVKGNPSKYGAKPPYVDLLNFGNYYGNGYFLTEGGKNIQVLNNVKIGTSCLLTLTFPPKWTTKGYVSGSDTLPYPIILHGNGYGVENNNQIYSPGNGNLQDIGDVANAGLAFEHLPRHKGVISIYVNNGGRESFGINQGLLDTLQYFMQTFMPSYGGDPNRILTIGGSRGGSEAGIWGTLQSGMNVRTILGAVPPVRIGKTTQFSVATFPAQGAAYMTALGSPNGWKLDYAGLSRTEKAKALGRIILGVDTANAGWDTAMDNRSLYGRLNAANTDSLKHKFIQFSTGTHDAFFPLAYFLQMDSMLTQRGINHSMVYAYAMGHNVDIHYPSFESELVRSDTATGPGSYSGPTRQYFVPKKIAFNAPTSHNPTDVWWMNEDAVDSIYKYRPTYFSDGSAHDPGKLGFSAVVPYLFIKDQPFEIVMTGENGKSWKLWARPENGYARKFLASGTFGTPGATAINPAAGITKEEGEEFAILKNVIFGDTAGLEWFFEYDGKEVPNRFTPWVSSQFDSTGVGNAVSQSNYFLRAQSHGKNSESELSGYEQYSRANAFSPLSNGVDQIHPLLFEANLASSLRAIPNSTLSLSALGANMADFLVPYYCDDCTGSGNLFLDADKDTLSFDLRHANGNYLPGGIMNRRSGYFQVPKDSLAVGVDTLRASLSDGKGGTIHRDFVLTISP